jgi:hypothetical protein
MNGHTDDDRRTEGVHTIDAAELHENPTTFKRAQWEAFEFRVPAQGVVRVENGSYGDESDEHVYVVETDGDTTTGCTCPADEYQAGDCKHRVAVELNSVVLDAAAADDGERAAADVEVSA